MNKIFCSACGHKNIYEVTQPKFCAGCGAGMGVAASLAGGNKVSASKMEVDIEPDEKVGDFDLEKMRREIVAEANTNKIKLTDIMGSSSGGSDEFTREAANLPDGDELIQRSQRDCGSSKPIDIDGE